MDLQRLDKVVLPKDFRERSPIVVQLWWIVQATLFGCSPQFMYGWRNFLLKLFGAEIGTGVKIRPTARVTFPWKITLGDFSRIGDNVVLYSLDQIVIGDHTVVSQGSYLCSGTHDYKDSSFQLVLSPIIVSDQVWLAADVFISPGIKIGHGCVVGARSSVFSDLPAEWVCYGYPAKPIKKRHIDNHLKN